MRAQNAEETKMEYVTRDEVFGLNEPVGEKYQPWIEQYKPIIKPRKISLLELRELNESLWERVEVRTF